MIASLPVRLHRPMGRALLASTGFHALALALIPALALVQTSDVTVETVTFTRITHIELHPRRLPHRPAPRAVAPERSRRVVLLRSTRVELTRTSDRKRASPPPTVATRLSSAPAVAAASSVSQGTGVQPGAQSTATPQPREVSSVVGRDTGGYLPFGAQQPDPVLDPMVRKQLATLGVHVTLVVTVGENGKTERVDFEPPVDPQLQSRIASLLADANWDPAVCGGGISCEGHATIKL